MLLDDRPSPHRRLRLGRQRRLASTDANLSNDPDWAHYRYRVLETIVPLRNVIWARALLPS